MLLSFTLMKKETINCLNLCCISTMYASVACVLGQKDMKNGPVVSFFPFKYWRLVTGKKNIPMVSGSLRFLAV